MNSEKVPNWPSAVLRIAAVYNIIWGAWVILFPSHLFDLTGIEAPNYPEIWQCIGMIVGVYGIGYWIASNDFVRHWPIVLVGFIGKILGPIGFLQSAYSGLLPWSWGVTILTNDIVWWLPFAAMLYLAAKYRSDPSYHPSVISNSTKHRAENKCRLSLGESSVFSFFRGAKGDNKRSHDANKAEQQSRTVEQVSRETMVSNGMNLWELGLKNKLLLVFVRHSGCTFCRETLIEIKSKLPGLQAQMIIPVVVHMGTAADGQKMMERAGLQGTHHISNQNADLYRAFDLKRGQLSQLLGPRVWWRGFQSAILKGNGTGSLVGDGFQLGGAFLVENDRITKSFPAKDAADKVPFECFLSSKP